MKAVLALALAALASGQTPARPRLSDAELGRRIFLVRCAACHGADAKGSAAFARQVGAYSPQSLDLTSERAQALTNAQLERRIQDGHGKMKGFQGKLAPSELSAVVAYLRLIGHARARLKSPAPSRAG